MESNVNLGSSGLFCRYGHGCQACFHARTSSSWDDLQVAVSARDLHERKVHGYKHVPQDTTTWAFHRLSSHGTGRSLLGRKH